MFPNLELTKQKRKLNRVEVGDARCKLNTASTEDMNVIYLVVYRLYA